MRLNIFVWIKRVFMIEMPHLFRKLICVCVFECLVCYHTCKIFHRFINGVMIYPRQSLEAKQQQNNNT